MTAAYANKAYDPTHDAVSPSQNGSKPPLTERNRCVRYLCCACCLPVWARWIVWFIIVAIIILIIIFAALFATFTMPSFDFAGVSNSTSDTQQSRLSFDGHVAKINFDLLIHAQNPNVLGIDLSQINATAYYPSSSGPINVGGGYLDHQFVSPHANENFSFPFAIEYDPFGPSHETILKLLIEKCGLTGGQPQDLNIDYTIHLTAKVLFVTVHPTIQSSTTFKCPLEDGSALLGSGMPGLQTLGGILHGR